MEIKTIAFQFQLITMEFHISNSRLKRMQLPLQVKPHSLPCYERVKEDGAIVSEDQQLSVSLSKPLLPHVVLTLRLCPPWPAPLSWCHVSKPVRTWSTLVLQERLRPGTKMLSSDAE